jgi:hypothetical protein
MVRKGRAQQGFAVFLFGVSVLAFSSCSSGPSGSSGPSISARAICTAVGRQLGAPPFEGGTHWLTGPVVAAGEHSGYSSLDSGVIHLSQGMAHHDTATISGAETAVETACSRLGIWHTYH